MAAPADVLRVAEGELGYYAPDDPEPGSKYGRWLADLTGESWLRGASTEIWWCCLFVSWVLDRAGQACPGFPTYNTDLAIRGGASGRLVDKASVVAGDILIFDWDWTTPATDHIGLVVRNRGDGRAETIEGNVGNRVCRKVRPLSSVRYAVRPPYDGAGAVAGGVAGANPSPGTLVVDGWLGNLSVTAWQRALATGAYDGVVSGQSRANRAHVERLVSVTWEGGGSLLARAVQRRVGAEADGYIGPKTVAALQAWLNARGHGLAVDGYLGPLTAMAVQRSLNLGQW